MNNDNQDSVFRHATVDSYEWVNLEKTHPPQRFGKYARVHVIDAY